MPLANDLIQIGINSVMADWLGDTVDAAVAPTGTDQAHAALVTATINIIPTATLANCALILPSAASFKGPYMFFKNLADEAVKLYPALGERIDTTLNKEITLLDMLDPAVGNWAILIKYDVDKWVSLSPTTP
jgi:hypothetical protein